MDDKQVLLQQNEENRIFSASIYSSCIPRFEEKNDGLECLD